MKLLRIEVAGWAGVDNLVVLNPGRLLELWSEEHGQGKSSALEPLLALAGGKARIADGPTTVRKGRKKASATVEWEHDGATYRADLSVAKSGNLSVKLSDEAGQPVAKPRQVLGAFFGRLYDPAEFRDWSKREQLDFARGLAGAEWSDEMERLQAAEQEAAQERTMRGRELRALGRVEPVPAAEPVDVSAVAEELERAEAHNTEVRQAEAAAQRADEEVQRREHQLRQIKKELEADLDGWALARQAVDGALKTIDGSDAPHQLEQELDDLVTRASAMRNAADRVRRSGSAVTEAERSVVEARKARETLANPAAPIDTASLRQQLTEASQRNAAAERYRTYRRELQRHQQVTRAHAEAEAAVEEIREAVAEHQRNAPLPAGLVVTDDGLEWQGRPLARASTCEGYRLGFELARLSGQRLLVADRAESLDRATVAELEQWCRESDMVAVLATLGRAHTEGALELRNGRLVTEDDLGELGIDDDLGF